MHIGSGTDLEHLSQVCGAMEQTLPAGRPEHHQHQRRRRPAPPSTSRAISTSISPRTSNCGTPPAQKLASEFGHAISLEIEPGRYLVAESGYLIAEIRAVKRMGENLVLHGRRRLQQSRPPDPLRQPPPDGDLPRRWLEAPHAAPKPSSSAARCANRATSLPKKKAASWCSRELPTASVGDYLVIGCAGAYGYVMASNYNSQAAGGRSAGGERQSESRSRGADV